MIPLTFLYEEYIDRPKLSEQKNPFEYIVPPPARGIGTIIISIVLIHLNNFQKFQHVLPNIACKYLHRCELTGDKNFKQLNSLLPS